MAAVTFEHVSKKYPGSDIFSVNDLNIEIRDKEFLVLVGPSGCGKSTALRMIAGLEEITSGVLRIGERVVNNVPPKDRDIAMVFQSYALYPLRGRGRDSEPSNWTGWACRAKRAVEANPDGRAVRPAPSVSNGAEVTRPQFTHRRGRAVQRKGSESRFSHQE
jgi:hypothetical protein